RRHQGDHAERLARGAAVRYRGRVQDLRRQFPGRRPSGVVAGRGACPGEASLRGGGHVTRERSNTWLAVVLIGVGALALVGNVGWFGPRSGWAWGIAFGLVGAAFLALYARERGLWWALFPGFAALGLAAAAVAGSLGGALFLALAAAAFVAVFLTNRRRTWAIVPGGVLATLALMALLEAIWPRAATDWLLFTGLAVTFAVMYLRPAGSRPNWALQIAIGLVALAVVAAVTGRLVGVLVAITLIAAGGFFAWRA